MVKTAVILAAGLGSRLKDRTKEKPKGFLELEGISLIRRSLDNLFSAGIEKVYIGTGYLHEFYDSLSRTDSRIETILSDRYTTTSSMYTLYNMRDRLKNDFLLLESDLLYERSALIRLLGDPEPDLILGSGKTGSNDEVYIETDSDGNLVNMSKKPEALSSLDAELVGISKVSLERYFLMNQAYEELNNPKIDYEYIFVQTAGKRSFPVRKIENLIWCEIDDELHLERAIKKILPGIKEKDNMPVVKRNVLLNPGPATTTDTVKMAQVVPDICPRESEFGDLMEYISRELTAIVADPLEYTTVLFGGSGTAADEAMLTSVVPREKAVLIINNGAYGKRLCQIAETFDMDFVEFKSSSIEPIDMKELEEAIQKKGNLSHLAAIHHETTTGILNNLADLGALARKYNLEFMVDAMSSYAALPIDMKALNVHYMTASSNKCIQGMAGVSFVIANLESLKNLKDIKPRSFYLNLYAQYEGFIKTHQMRFTPPVQTLYALKQAIAEAKEEGIENRYKRYSRCWELLITELKSLGLKYLIEDQYHSRLLTSIFIPDGVDFEDMHDYMYERGYTIYPGKVNDYDTFRIANIGALDYRDMEAFLKLLREYLKVE